MTTTTHTTNQPTKAYRLASYVTFAVGGCGFLLGLWNADLLLSEKGFYLAIFLLGLFSAVTLQKTVRDTEEGIVVNKSFTVICWSSFFAAIGMLVLGLFNAEMLLSEKGFYAMAFLVSLFSAITIQKNTRDVADEVDNKPAQEATNASEQLLDSST
jgi:uncharacterized membrane protein YiaA